MHDGLICIVLHLSLCLTIDKCNNKKDMLVRVKGHIGQGQHKGGRWAHINVKLLHFWGGGGSDYILMILN